MNWNRKNICLIAILILALVGKITIAIYFWAKGLGWKGGAA